MKFETREHCQDREQRGKVDRHTGGILEESCLEYKEEGKDVQGRENKMYKGTEVQESRCSRNTG